MCRFISLELDTEYAIRVRCCAGERTINGRWSEVAVVRTQRLPAPSNVRVKSDTWDSITLTWDAVEGASFYQIEVDESKFWNASTTNAFTKRGLLPETDYTFRVRTVKGNTVSEWSVVVKGRTQKELFETSRWKECPDYVDGIRKYSVDEKNPRIATFIGGNWCTIIGNTPLPPNTVTSWNIKILESRDNNGDCIYIGIAPSNIDQNVGNNYILLDGTLIAMILHYGLDLLTITVVKSMDQGKKTENTSTQGTVLAL